MLVIGTGGFSKQLLSALDQLQLSTALTFYTDFEKDEDSWIQNHYPSIHGEIELEAYFEQHSKHFILAIGGPKNREEFYHKALGFGGKPMSVFHSESSISPHGTRIEAGSIILNQAIVEPCSKLGLGTLVNVSAFIGHDCSIGNFCEISPGAKLLGGVSVGDRCFVGAGAIILPGLHLSNDCIVGAGAVVCNSVQEGECVVGNPAVSIKQQSK